MADLRLQHRLHHVGHRPHALADLRLAAETAGQADADIAILIGGDPVRRLHLALGDHRARAHRGVDLVARAVEEAGVDEDRSEEHTSELQSLMRNSYDVICLNKNKNPTT